jgi:hypothetical protein
MGQHVVQLGGDPAAFGQGGRADLLVSGLSELGEQSSVRSWAAREARTT